MIGSKSKVKQGSFIVATPQNTSPKLITRSRQMEERILLMPQTEELAKIYVAGKKTGAKFLGNIALADSSKTLSNLYIVTKTQRGTF